MPSRCVSRFGRSHLSRDLSAPRSLSASDPNPSAGAASLRSVYSRSSSASCASSDRLDAETNAAARRVDLEDDDLDVGADGKCLRDVRFPGDAGLAQRNEAGASRREEHEHAELLVTLDLAREARARHDLGRRRRRAAGSRRALRQRARRRSASSRGRCSGSRMAPVIPTATDRTSPPIARSARTSRRAPALRPPVRARRTRRTPRRA